MAPASTAAATISARRSPIRAASDPEGRAPASWPTPRRATVRAAVPTDAPSSRALSASTGRTAPWPRDASTVGPTRAARCG